MTVVNRHLEEGGPSKGITPNKFHDSALKGRYLFETFQSEPLCTVPGGTLTDPAGTSLQNIRIDTGFNVFEFSYLGDATAAFVPTLASDGGYNWGVFNTDGLIGAEINFGGQKNGHPRNFIPRNEDWFLRVLFNVDNWSGVDIVVGFRKAGAAVATLTEVTDVAGIRILGDSSSALAALSAITNLNNGGTSDYISTAIDTGSLTDGTTVEVEVRSIAGKAQFFVNSNRVASGVSYTFDSGDVCSPVVRMLETTDLVGQMKTMAAECGPMVARVKRSLQSLAGDTV